MKLEETIVDTLCSSSPKLSDLRLKKIMLGSKLAGLACAGPSCGDLLVRLSIFKSNFLVLRHCHDEYFDIIGQAILLEDFDLEGEFEDYEKTKQNVPKVRVELKISAEDAIVLFAQDMGDSHFDTMEEDRLKRVVTKVTFNPHGAARVTIVTQLLAKNAA